jgi:hypothetical protein
MHGDISEPRNDHKILSRAEDALLKYISQTMDIVYNAGVAQFKHIMMVYLKASITISVPRLAI